VLLAEWLPVQSSRVESGLVGSFRGLATRLCLQNLGWPCTVRTFHRLTSRLRQNRSRFQCCLTEKSPLYECPKNLKPTFSRPSKLAELLVYPSESLVFGGYAYFTMDKAGSDHRPSGGDAL
jgi:hypothetical protein